jgi:hypothetical protein
MKYRKEIMTTAGTLGCAVAIGFFMQNSQPLPEAAALQGMSLANADAAVLDVQEIILTSADYTDDFITPTAEEAVTLAAAQEIVPPMPSELPSVQSVSVTPAPLMRDATQPTLAQEPACEIIANARAVAAAMVNLTLDASCLPGEGLTVHHSGLVFNQATDASGSFDIIVPAMAQEAVFIFAFGNGEGAVAQTNVEELSDYDRVALQWKGDTGFELHAREYGSDYGAQGHVWSGAPRDVTTAITGAGGFITRLGDLDVPDGFRAEIYTFPTGTAQIAGEVDLSVEAEVASNNCGLEIEAKTLQTHSGFEITSRDLTLSVPDCDAAGNFLVLNNLLEDLKVALN